MNNDIKCYSVSTSKWKVIGTAYSIKKFKLGVLCRARNQLSFELKERANEYLKQKYEEYHNWIKFTGKSKEEWIDISKEPNLVDNEDDYRLLEEYLQKCTINIINPIPTYHNNELLWLKVVKRRPNSGPTHYNSDSSHPYMISKPIKILSVDCCICLDNCVNTVIVPCGHVCICEDCKQKIKDNKCPICRQQITQIIKTYIC